MSLQRGPVLALVPARGGSRGLVRKNMRLLDGAPLIAYTIDALSQCRSIDRVVVSSDDEAILGWAELRGSEVLRRDPDLATSAATISDVAAAVADELDWAGVVAIFQPTSPLRRPDSVEAALAFFDRHPDARSLGSVARLRHLHWYDDSQGLDASVARPLFSARVNRQFAEHRVLAETGSIQLVEASALRAGRQVVTDAHVLFEMDPEESIDIDGFDDFAAVRRRLEAGLVIFRLRANHRTGSGHLYHCLQLAEELADMEIHFLLLDCDDFVSSALDRSGYEWAVEQDLASALAPFATIPRRLVVNDVLDTSETDVLLQRGLGFRVVNIEDLGPGAAYADWVVNALYPLSDADPTRVSVGPRWAPLRTEFAGLPERHISEVARRVLVTFGGTDPLDLTSRVAHSLADVEGINVRVVVGPGARPRALPSATDVATEVRSMASEMIRADIVVTSAGRTVYEAAATGTPVIVIAQNAREATHAHLTADSAVIYLGLGPMVSDAQIAQAVRSLLEAPDLRRELSARLRAGVDHRGAERIGDGIRRLLGGGTWSEM